MDENKILLPELFFSVKDYKQGVWQGRGGVGGLLPRDGTLLLYQHIQIQQTRVP